VVAVDPSAGDGSIHDCLPCKEDVARPQQVLVTNVLRCHQTSPGDLHVGVPGRWS